MKKEESIKINMKYFLEKVVGKSPSKSQMKIIDERMSRLNSLAKKGLLKKNTKALYDEELSEIWTKIVAYENTGSEINLLLKNVKIKSNSRVVSIGSGLCVFEMFIARKLVPRGFVHCFDFSKNMNKKAKSIARKLSINNLKVTFADAKKIPLVKNSQDVVLARRTGLSSTRDWVKVLREVSRVLREKTNSIFVYTVSRDFNFSLEKIKKQLLDVGLVFVKMKSFKEKDGSIIDMIIAKKNLKEVSDKKLA